MTDVASSLSAGLAALADGRWEDAVAPLEGAVAAHEDGAALEALGLAYFWIDHPDTIDVRERAYRAYREEGDARGAARLATVVAYDYVTFRGELAVGQGWLDLAGRCLAEQPLSPEHGFLAAWEADFAISRADLVAAERRAGDAVEIGRELKVPDIELLGQAQRGYLLVGRGHIAEGMRLLDASAAAAVAGEFADPSLAGYACCYAISAASAVHDYQRAAQWCRRVDDLCRRVGFHSLQHFCRVQYAAVLIQQGEWERAESEILTAAENLGARRPAIAGEALVKLADLRRRQGRATEAEALYLELEGHTAALVGRAWLALDTGDAETAASLASRYLRQVPADEITHRIRGLQVIARARAAQSDPAGGRRSLDEIEAGLDSEATGPQRAGVRLTEALLFLAEADLAAARTAAEDAMDAFDRVGAPFDSAEARAVLARILLASGDETAARREVDAAARAYDVLGAGPFAERVRAMVVTRPVPSVLTAREVDVLRLVADGLGNAEIATRLVLSEHTVHRHIGNLLGKLEVSNRAAAVARATTLGLL